MEAFARIRTAKRRLLPTSRFTLESIFRRIKGSSNTSDNGCMFAQFAFLLLRSNERFKKRGVLLESRHIRLVPISLLGPIHIPLK